MKRLLNNETDCAGGDDLLASDPSAALVEHEAHPHSYAQIYQAGRTETDVDHVLVKTFIEGQVGKR